MTLGIRGRLFLVAFGLIAASIAAAYAFLRAEIEDELTRHVREDLQVRAQIVADRAAKFHAADLDFASWDALADDLGARTETRVTLIGPDGVVRGDSEVSLTRLHTLENHATRPEVRAALHGGVGTSQRFSATIGRQMLYVAVPSKLGDEPRAVARLAMPLTRVEAALDRFRHLLALGALVGLAVALVLSSVAAELASRNARALTRTARRMAEGDLDVRTRMVVRDEFGALGDALDQLASNLSRSLRELKSERDLMSGILTGMQEGVLVVGHDGRVALTNPALREMLLLGADIVGKSPLEAIRHSELKTMLDEARGNSEPVVRELTLGGLKPRIVLVRAAHLGGHEGDVCAVFVDVTERRRLESVRRDFVANVSHELRTPVAAISSAAETLDGAGARDPGALAAFLPVIVRNAERLHQLVEDLLELSRIESREFKIHLEPVDLGAECRHTVELFRERAHKRSIELMQTIPADVPAAYADRRALEHVLVNLVDNAVKYSGTGARVVLEADADASSVNIAVSDNGPGIEERHLARIFERFYRIDPGRSRELGGTGLGLSIVKNLVEAMGGRVHARSELGRGATFVVRLPRADRVRDRSSNQDGASVPLPN